MLYLATENLVPGMILDSDLKENGSVILGRGTELTEHLIEVIINRNIKGCCIQGAEEENHEEEIDSPLLKKQFPHSYKALVDCKSLSTAKNLVKSPKILREKLYPVITEVINNSTKFLSEIEGIEFNDSILTRSVNTSILSIALGSVFDLTYSELLSIGYGSIFSDFGMFFISDEIREKASPLTKDEYAIVRTHCRKGLDFVRKNLNLPLSTYQTILDHHERWDGSGYPEGRKGENISKYARIVMIADVYDALTRNNAYRQAFSPNEAIEYIMGGSGVLFDPKFTKAFVNRITPYPVGTTIELSDGTYGIVYSVNENKQRPIVKIFGKGNILFKTPELIDLNDTKHLNLTILRIIEAQTLKIAN